MKITFLAPALAAVLAVAACSSSGGGGASPTSSAPAPSTSSSSAPSSSTPAPSSSAGSSPVALTTGLLTASDVGTGYVQDPADNSPESTLPCTPNDPPLFTQVPPRQRGSVSFTSQTQKVGVSEDVAVYNDVASAQRAVAVSVKGFMCTSGSLDGTKATIKDTKTVTVAGADSAQIWDLAAGQFVASAILVRTGTKLVGLVFAAAPGAGQNVPIQQITETATKRAAAIG